MSEGERLERARQLYERAVFGGDIEALWTAEHEVDAVEADLALARGRLLHARFLAEKQDDPRELPLFEQAAALYHQLGDLRGEAESLFWIGAFHQVVRGDTDTALPVLEAAYQLAAQAGDTLTLSYAARHLGFADMAEGRLDRARERLEESVRLRREAGFQPGVAAGLLSLAQLAARAGHRDQAMALLDEAAAVAEASGAQGVLGWIGQARTAL